MFIWSVVCQQDCNKNYNNSFFLTVCVKLGHEHMKNSLKIWIALIVHDQSPSRSFCFALCEFSTERREQTFRYAMAGKVQMVQKLHFSIYRFNTFWHSSEKNMWKMICFSFILESIKFHQRLADSFCSTPTGHLLSTSVE